MQLIVTNPGQNPVCFYSPTAQVEIPAGVQMLVNIDSGMTVVELDPTPEATMKSFENMTQETA